MQLCGTKLQNNTWINIFAPCASRIRASMHDSSCRIDDRVPRPLQNENVSFAIIVESLK